MRPLRLCERNKVDAAAQLWFFVQGKASIFRLAYDEEWKRYSPGSILTAYLMSKKSVKGYIEKLSNQTATKITPLKIQKKGRRLMDNNAGLTHEPDRRTKNAERRNLDTINYASPARRYTIDRRTGVKERRSA